MATKKKTTKRTPAAKKPTARKKSTKKAPAKKAATKKVARKKAASSSRVSKTTKKSTAKKAAAKKSTTKKKVAKKVVKKAAASKKKAVTKKTTSKKKVAKKTTRTTKKKTTNKKAPARKQTTKKAPAKKPARAAKPKAPASEESLEDVMQHEWTVAELRKVKTGLKKKDLDYFRTLLQEKLVEIVGNIKGMELTRSDALADIAHMPLHMADVGSDNFDQEFTLGLMEFERKILSDIKDALVRMKDGIYGVCLDSGRPISRARLEAKPWAKYCIEAARLHEKRGW